MAGFRPSLSEAVMQETTVLRHFRSVGFIGITDLKQTDRYLSHLGQVR